MSADSNNAKDVAASVIEANASVGVNASYIDKVKSDMEKAMKLKDDGNNDYKFASSVLKGHSAANTRMIDACVKYANALSLLQAIENESIPKDLEPEFKQLKLSLLLNLAGAGLLLESYESVINSCNAALAMDPDNPKALYRRSKAHFSNSKPEKETDKTTKSNKIVSTMEQARDDIYRAYDLLPSSKEIKDWKEFVDAKITSSKKKTIKSFSELLKQVNLDKYLFNGGHATKFSWGQSKGDVHLFVPIKRGTTSKSIKCDIHRMSMSLTVSSDSVFNGLEFPLPVTAEESTWAIPEIPSNVVSDIGVLYITLHKEPASFTSILDDDSSDSDEEEEEGDSVEENGKKTKIKKIKEGKIKIDKEHEDIRKVWWDRVFKSINEATVNPDDCIISEGSGKKGIAASEEQFLSFDPETEEKKAVLKERAMKDEGKKKLAEMLENQFPGIPIEFR